MATHAKPSEATRRVSVGSVPLGGGAPVVVQSMLNAPATDVAANLVQIDALAQAGCEIVRMAIPHRSSLDVFQAVCDAVALWPVVADIHFDARSLSAARAAKLRMQPRRTSGGLAKTDAVLDAAGEAGIPIRIGVNAGSLDNELAARDDLSQSEKLARSAADYVRYCEGRGFHDLVVSAKAHDVMTTVRTYRLLSKELPHVPLHIGVTEAGTTFQGAIKSACGLGILLEEGIGDTLRISLTDDLVNEIRACWTLLAALDLRRRAPSSSAAPPAGAARSTSSALPSRSRSASRRCASRSRWPSWDAWSTGPARPPTPTSAWPAATAWASFFPKARPSARSTRPTSWTL